MTSIARTTQSTKNTVLAFFAGLFVLFAGSAFAAEQSRLIVPSFSVDLDGGKTHIFSVVNTADQTASVRITVYSNWGVEVLTTFHQMAPHAARSYNLADWLVAGELPDRQLSAEDLDDLQAALSGREVPTNELNYSTEKGYHMAHGSLLITSSQGFTFGDFFSFDPAGNNAEGDQLVDLAPDAGCGTGPAGERHAIRFFTNGPLRTDTEVILHTERHGKPSQSPDFPGDEKVAATLSIYSMSGELVETREMDCLPLDVIKVSELGLPIDNGWIDVTTSEEAFMSVRYSADDRFSVGLSATCLPAEEGR